MSVKLSKDDASLLYRMTFNRLQRETDALANRVSSIEGYLLEDQAQVLKRERELAQAREGLAEHLKALEILERLS